MATTVKESITRSETVSRPYPGEHVRESRHPGSAAAFGSLMGRLLISQIFLASGVAKVLDWAGTITHMTEAFRGFFESLQLAPGISNAIVAAIPVLLAIAIVVELAAGLGVLFGCKTRLSACALFAFLIPTTLIFHSFWRFPEAEQQLQTIMFMKNLAIMGGLSLLMSFGAGRISFDARKRSKDLEE